MKPLKLLTYEGEPQPFWYLYETESKFFAEHKEDFVISSGEERLCRFCKKDSKNTTFNMKAHVIPEFMGNKHLLSHFECDNCNMLFSKYESHLSNYLGVWRTLSLLDGKKGVPKFEDKKDGEKLKVEYEAVERQLNFRISGKSKSDIESIKIGEELITLKSKKRSYIPRDALKALVKIAFSMLNPNNLESYEKTRQWLVNEFNDRSVTEHPLFQVYFNNGKLLPSPMVMLLTKKKQFKDFPAPNSVLLLFYGVLKYQLFLPFHVDEEKIFKDEDFCLPIEQNWICKLPLSNTPKVNMYNLSSKEPRKDELQSISWEKGTNASNE